MHITPLKIILGVVAAGSMSIGVAYLAGTSTSPGHPGWFGQEPHPATHDMPESIGLVGAPPVGPPAPAAVPPLLGTGLLWSVTPVQQAAPAVLVSAPGSKPDSGPHAAPHSGPGSKGPGPAEHAHGHQHHGPAPHGQAHHGRAHHGQAHHAEAHHGAAHGSQAKPASARAHGNGGGHQGGGTGRRH